jgi:hypothetical protein
MFSVGILYSAQEFLGFAHNNSLSVEQFSKQTRFVLASAENVLQVAQNCQWVRLTPDGNISVTDKGLRIVDAADSPAKLRIQIVDLIDFEKPPWAMKIRHGRQEAIVSLSADAGVRQCFQECGLLGAWSDASREWWISTGQLVRAQRQERLALTGATAEKWTIEYESERVGQIPEWKSIESNFAGFDVLSRISVSDESPLRIEVKGSERKPKEADFTVTRHEFRTATLSQNYVFYLWHVATNKQLFVVPFAEVKKQIPTDQNDGRWELTNIPFSSFSSFRVL